LANGSADLRAVSRKTLPGLTKHALAKACQRLRIPVPPRGYWVKAHHGRRLTRPALRESPGGKAVEIVS